MPASRYSPNSSLATSYRESGLVPRTDPDKARALVPEPLVLEDPVVSLTFLFMVAPGLGDYYEISQSVPVSLNGEGLSFRPSMYASSVAAILDGREIWGLSQEIRFTDAHRPERHPSGHAGIQR